MTFGNVEAFAEKFGVTKDVDFTVAEVVDDLSADIGRSLAVDMSGGNACVDESLRDGLGMIDVDAIADSGFAVGEFEIIIDDVAGNFFIVHDFIEVVGIEIAVADTNVVKVDVIDRGGEVFKTGEIAEMNKLINGGSLNHRIKNVAESFAAHAERSSGDAEQKSFRISLEDFLISIG